MGVITFENTCNTISKNCIYSEDSWGGGVVAFNRLFDLSVNYSPEAYDDAFYMTDMIVEHVHNSHIHCTKHISPNVPSDNGDESIMDSESSKKTNEWLNQEDLDDDGSIYGGQTTEVPILRSLKDHPCWEE